MIVGIDEAGRGSVLSSLVVCGVAVPDYDFQNKLLEIGVKDSKRITGKKKFERRANIASQIRRITANHVITESVTAAQIDKYRQEEGNLDDLERSMASIIIRRFLNMGHIDQVICDGQLFAPLKEKYSSVRCFNKADDLYPVVSAASICAKNTRDQTVRLIMGDAPGGGYPNRWTWEWIKKDYEKNGKYSDHIRKTWSWFIRKSKEYQINTHLEDSYGHW